MRRPVRVSKDAGAATVEFVFAGVLLLVPLLYLVLALFEVQRNAFAVTQAAREAGRAIATAEKSSAGRARAVYAVQLALADQGLAGGAELRWGPPGAGCDGAPVPVPPGAAATDGTDGTDGAAATDGLTLDSTVSLPLVPGADIEICVARTYRAPGVPGFLDSGRNTVRGRYLVHLDDFRAVR